MRFIILISCLLFALSSCQDAPKTDDATAKKEMATQTEPTATAPASPERMSKGAKYTLTPFTPSPAYADAKIESFNMTNKKFEFGVSDGEYKLGEQTEDAPRKNCANSDKGQHLHVLIDDKPYAAKYTSSFDLDIADGEHRMLAFLSRSYHESIKTASAHKAQYMMVENGSIKKAMDIKEPMIWYSRPKGTYKGKASTDKVMLDFYLINTDLKGGNQVKADINGEVHMLSTWQPYYIEGLPMGENTITLTLLNKEGTVLSIPQNPISRTFTLAADPGE